MARPVKLKKEDVFEAVRQIEDEGGHISVTTVRKRIGKGSFSTIKTMLEEWNKLQEQEKKVEVPEMPAHIVSAVNRLWTEAWKSALQLLDGERQALHKERLKMDEERREMGLKIERLEEELKKVSQKLASSKESVKTLYTDKTRLEERLLAEERKNVDKEAIIQQLQAEIREVRLDTEKASLDLYDEKGARSKAEKESVRLQENLKHVQKQSEKDIARLEEQVKELEEQLSQARDAISQEQERRKEMEKEMIKLKVELAVIKEIKRSN